jgi:hypothetical protein
MTRSILPAFVLILAICGSAGAVDHDLSTTRLSDAELFRVSFRSMVEPPPINRLHQWVVHVETPDGHPVEAAKIEIDGGMPEHGHGLPTQPEMDRELGHGDYEIDGMKFQMSGWWVVKFHITSGGQSDQVTFNLALAD